MADSDEPLPPSLPWRIGSVIVMGGIGTLVRTFMNIPNTQRAHGLDRFLDLVDDREDVGRRKRGLITGTSNPTPTQSKLHHWLTKNWKSRTIYACTMDDPFIWGVLPLRYHFNPSNHRWSLASYDICFNKGRALDLFWTLGQTLPTHRIHHSPNGGLFQPTMREAIRLLSHPPPFPVSTTGPPSFHHATPNITDPFTSPTTPYTYTYSTNALDTFPAPSAFSGRHYSWIHIFPEGRVHQHPHKTMRYFKWGVARLILEPDVCPDIVPMWVEGNEQIMHETRGWPRWLPRAGKRCGVWFGGNVRGEFEGLRGEWRGLVEEVGSGADPLGDLSEELKYGERAVRLREECALQVRKAVLKVRRESGLEDEDPKQGLVETWREEGGKREGRMDDGSIVRDT